MDKIEEDFEKAQQELLDKFKSRMKLVAEEVLDKVYCDISNWATSDAHTNFYNHLREEMRQEFKKAILKEDYGHTGWANSIRIDLLKNHEEELRTQIISDLQNRIKQLEEHLYERSRY